MGNRGPHKQIYIPEGDGREDLVKHSGRQKFCKCGKRIACDYCSDNWGWFCCGMGNKKECSGNKRHFSIGATVTHRF
jgi:hypothetical protein